MQRTRYELEALLGRGSRVVESTRVGREVVRPVPVVHGGDVEGRHAQTPRSREGVELRSPSVNPTDDTEEVILTPPDPVPAQRKPTWIERMGL